MRKPAFCYNDWIIKDTHICVDLIGIDQPICLPFIEMLHHTWHLLATIFVVDLSNLLITESWII